MTEFVEDWSIIQTLGEGAFGEVKLLVHQKTGETVAVKIIDLEKHKDAAEAVKKEVCIHKIMIHPNVIRYYGQRKESLKEYIFLEYACAGELFNKIEPDIGMPAKETHRYFQHLLQGLEYIHTKGIAHRDIKPENLLIDASSTLKISDFGMATVFRLRGRERLLERRCGTLPYIAPEVLSQPYKAQPSDVWACGIVLTAMLSGELPWDEPIDDNEEFADWKNGKYMLLSPWKKLDTTVLSLIRCILNPNPDQRFTIEKIKSHRWMNTEFHEEDTVDCDEIFKPAKRLCSNDEISLTQKVVDKLPVGLSQPVPVKQNQNTGQVVNMIQDRDHIWFSQPAHFDDLFVESQIQFTQSPINKNNFHKLICRMTRFTVKTDCEKTLKILCSVLEKLSYCWSTDDSGLITISTVDIRKMQLIFKANIINMDGKLLLDFRLSKGCGLEFKKRFLKIRNNLKDIIHHDEP